MKNKLLIASAILWFVSIFEVSSQSKTSYLSDLQWVASETFNQWPDPLPKKDKNTLGGNLAVGGVVYSKGLGCHADAQVVYSLSGQYKYFRSILGSDDASGCTVSVKVMADGVQIYSNASITQQNPPIVLDLNITGVDVLKLVMDKNGDASGDWIDWPLAMVTTEPMNNAPVMDDIVGPQLLWNNDAIQTVKVKGINDGDQGTQTLTLTATSSNPSILAIDEILYTPGEDSALVKLKPMNTGYGDVKITVTLKDDGGVNNLMDHNTTTKNFTVTVKNPDINNQPTLNPILDRFILANTGNKTVTLSGISDGDILRNQLLTITAVSSNPTFIPNPGITYTQESDHALLTYVTPSVTGNTLITVKVKDNGGRILPEDIDSITQTFRITVADSTGQSFKKLTTNMGKAYQKIEGFGAFNTIAMWVDNNDKTYSQIMDSIVYDLGLSMLRLELPPTFQPAEGGSYNKTGNVFGGWTMDANFKDVRELHRRGVDKFIATVWSPPAWMKTNGSEYNGGNLKTNYYQKFANYLVAYCRVFKEETGVDLYGIGIQNEPQFDQPTFNSCVYNWNQYRDVEKVVGKTFKDSSITTFLYGSEVLPAQNNVLDYFRAMNNDAEVATYMHAFAIHNYDQDGLRAGSASGQQWASYYNEARRVSPYKQTWMTETSGHDTTWLGRTIGTENVPGAFVLATNIYNALKFGKISAWVWWALSDGGGSYRYDLVNDKKPTKKYFVSKQFSKFIRPGAEMVDVQSNDSKIFPLAFRNETNGQVTYIIINTDTSEKMFSMNGFDKQDYKAYRTSATENCMEVTPVTDNVLALAPSSITTLVTYLPINHSPTIDQVEDISSSKSGPISVPLTGISAGVGESSQTLTMSVESNNLSLIAMPVLDYVEGSATGTLTLVPTDGKFGETTITVKITDSNNDVFSTTYMSFKVTVSAPDAVADELSDKIKVYPNPVNDEINVSIPDVQNMNSLTIIDYTGKLVFMKELKGEKNFRINVKGLTPGLYIICVNGKNTSFNERFVKF